MKVTSTSSVPNISDSIIDTLFDRYFSSIGPGVRGEQRDVIESVLKGNNTLSVMPTGGGKSLCYWIAGLALGGTTLVIFPLTALMDEQALKLREHGLSVTVLHSGIPGTTQYKQLIELYHDTLPNFIFTSPERLATDGFLEYVLRQRRSQIKLVVIDEIHCISQWGHDFRPTYTEISPFLNTVFDDTTKWPAVLGLTATLNEKDTAQICSDFRMSESSVYKSRYLLRYPIQITVMKVEDEQAKDELFWAKLEEHRADKLLIYIDNRKSGARSTEGFAAQAQQKGFKATYFHADIKSEEKADIIQKFKDGYYLTVFATSAFGMGIDIPDIRGVIHYRPPESIEQYYQQIGRVGRDSLPSWALLLYSDKNIQFRKSFFIDKGFPGVAELHQAFSILTNGHGTTKTFSYFSEPDAQSAYHYLVQKAVVAYRCKGLRSIRAFEKARGVDLPEFDRYQNAVRNGLTVLIALRLNISIEEATENIFQWLAEGKIRANSSPEKCLIIDQLVDELSDEIVQGILEEIEQKKQYSYGLLDELAAKLDAFTDSISFHQEIGRYLGVDKFQLSRVHQTRSGAMVRSKSEMIIANLLTEHGVDFQYEERLEAGGIGFWPDFTIRIGDNIWYWEHLGRLDLAQYRQNWAIKQQWYREHFPGQLIITEEGSALSRSVEELILRRFKADARQNGQKGEGETIQKPKTETVTSSTMVGSVRIFTEGPTDWKHLKAAWKRLKAQNNFPNFEIIFHESEKDMGDKELLNHCRIYSNTYQIQPIFCVFDRDVPDTLRKVTENSLGYKDWGNNVYSVALPVPPHRANTPDICIEFYYRDHEIQRRDANGRRLFIGTEFDDTTCLHESDPLTCALRNKTGKFTIVDSDVFSTESRDRVNVALSKHTFAEYVLANEHGFNDFDLEAFIQIFELIATLANQGATSS